MDPDPDPEHPFVVVMEIKATDWDNVKPKNVRKNLGSHRRQVWKYIDAYLDGEDRMDVVRALFTHRHLPPPGSED